MSSFERLEELNQAIGSKMLIRDVPITRYAHLIIFPIKFSLLSDVNIARTGQRFK